MSDKSAAPSHTKGAPNTPSQEFTAYCEAEFERRQNSGEGFDEAIYRKAMDLVMDKLLILESEGKA